MDDLHKPFLSGHAIANLFNLPCRCCAIKAEDADSSIPGAGWARRRKTPATSPSSERVAAAVVGTTFVAAAYWRHGAGTAAAAGVAVAATLRAALAAHSLTRAPPD